MRRYFAFPRFLHRFYTYRKNAWADTSDLRKIQEKKLRAIVRYAYENVPFYHRLFDANNVKPSDISSLNDLKRIPIVTRQEVQAKNALMISRRINAETCSKHSTSGSTGIPLTVPMDDNALETMWAVSLRMFFECGGRLRDTQVRLRGPGGMGPHPAKPFSEYIGWLRTQWITVPGQFSNALITYIEECRPDVMVGYPGFFQLLSEKASGKKINPRIVFCLGEALTPHYRRSMNSAFGAKIIDTYGSTETGDIAWECPDEHEGYHINVDSVIIEFVKDDEDVAPGEEGEIILTSLFNHAMPFIRYQIGDMGIPSVDDQCGCGRTLPLMKSITGRSDDFLILPDGKKVSPLGILNMGFFPEVIEYRIIQERRDLIEVWLRMTKGYRESSVTKCTSGLQKVLGESVEIKARVVDQIPRDPSGKLRRVVSKVNA